MKISKGIQILANLATVAVLYFSFMQLQQTTSDAQLANSIKLLDQGMQVEQDYREGKIQARQVLSFYYQVYLLQQSERLLADPFKALNLSLCRFVLDDPRAREYWQNAPKQYYTPPFIAFIDQITKSRKCA
ncbi:hypothetical protein J4P02_28130 [Pseudomonas sp. NFXW11]|uniref:hypothetical protein n=1 Tax=Pseudomonas sp. NFXW11 TaxID=2819531 RepID=UPI003CF84036